MKYFQFGGRVGGGTYSIPTPVNFTPVQRSIVTPFQLGQLPTKPVADRTGLKISDDLKEKLKGLTSDTNTVASKLNTIEMLSSSLTDLDILSGSTKYRRIQSEINDVLSPEKLNELRRNEEMFESALENVNENKDAVAVDGTGIWVRNGNLANNDTTFTKVGVNQFKDAINSGWIPLSAAELAEARQTNEALSFNNQAMSTMTEVAGLQSINDFMNKEIADLGEHGSKQAREGLFAVAQYQGTGLNGFDKFAKEGKSNKQQVDSLNSLWYRMPDNMKNQLRIQAIKQGSDDPEVGAKTLMASTFAKAYSSYSSLTLGTNDEFLGINVGGGSEKLGAIGSYISAVSSEDSKVVTFTSDQKDLQLKMLGKPVTSAGVDSHTVLEKTKLAETVGLNNAIYANGEPIKANKSTMIAQGNPIIVQLPLNEQGQPIIEATKLANKIIEQATTQGKTVTPEQINAALKQQYPSSELAHVAMLPVKGLDIEKTTFDLWGKPRFQEIPTSDRKELINKIGKDYISEQQPTWHTATGFETMIFIPIGRNEADLALLDKNVVTGSDLANVPKHAMSIGVLGAENHGTKPVGITLEQFNQNYPKNERRATTNK